MRETGPVFAALWAWSPWPLVGVVAAGWWRRSAKSEESWLVRPVHAAWELRRRIGLDSSLYVRPWGAALLGLAGPSWQDVLTVLVAHAQLVAAQDTIRLAVWAAPVLVLSAAKLVPLAWMPLAVLATAIHRDARA
jgi:hypothetical protein